MKDLIVDEARLDFEGATGIYVRAFDEPDGVRDSYDMAQLDKASFIEFARSRGVVSAWALSILFVLLGYDHAQETDTASCPQCGWTGAGPNADGAGYLHYEETGHVWDLHTTDEHTRLVE